MCSRCVCVCDIGRRVSRWFTPCYVIRIFFSHTMIQRTTFLWFLFFFIIFSSLKTVTAPPLYSCVVKEKPSINGIVHVSAGHPVYVIRMYDQRFIGHFRTRFFFFLQTFKNDVLLEKKKTKQINDLKNPLFVLMTQQYWRTISPWGRKRTRNILTICILGSKIEK